MKRSAWWKNRLGEGRCHYCGGHFSPNALTMDHMTPLIRGGRTSRSNCVAACTECNRNKRNLTSDAWKNYLEATKGQNNA
ncbi:MAG: HNH endonuclease [Magnetococcales bacterium]|nr:HNH endonuclease [Magnetococcales bacterium]